MAEIEIYANHNHPLENAKVLSFRRAGKGVQQRFIELFCHGSSASQAYHQYVTQVNLENNGDEIVLADAGVVPNIKTVHYWYENWQKMHHGDTSGINSATILDDKINQYKANGIIIWKSDDVGTNGWPLTLVILTPIMQRAHQLSSCKDIVFVDSPIW